MKVKPLKDALELKLDGFEKQADYIKQYCWTNLEHYDLNTENGSILMSSKVSLSHVKTIFGFMLLNCMTFIAVEIYWWVGNMESRRVLIFQHF